MNQHLPISNLREVTFTKPAVSEQFIVVRGKHHAWVDGDMMSRAEVIKDIDGDYANLRQIIAISLEAGTSRDATDDICRVVINRWAEDDIELGPEAYEFVEMVCGTTFANAFRREDA